MFELCNRICVKTQYYPDLLVLGRNLCVNLAYKRERKGKELKIYITN